MPNGNARSANGPSRQRVPDRRAARQVELHPTVEVATTQRLMDLFRADRERIASAGRRAGSMLRVHEALQARAVTSLAGVVRATGVTPPTAGSAMESLVAMGIARELTGKRRNRAFAYDRYLAILNEGTETP